jgi:hypothetical protein
MTNKQAILLAFAAGAVLGHYFFPFTVAIAGGLVGQWLYEKFVKSAL